jgi:tyrosyl-tRNA synthetase
MPDDLEEISITAPGQTMPIANVLKEAGLTKSTSEALRLVKQGAVRLDGERISESDLALQVPGSHILQVGKRRFARIILQK